MKRILKIIPVLIFVFAVGIAIGTKEKTEGITDKIVRFHIVADSNEEKAQEVKWKIREEIFKNTDLKNISTKENALLYFKNEKNNIEKLANEILAENNLPYKSKVYIEKKTFPIREYNSFILPSGTYDAVSIVLGSGKGENFFCVMYPSVCMVSSISEKTDDNPSMLGTVLTENETELVTDMEKKTVIKFKLAEMLNVFLSN